MKKTYKNKYILLTKSLLKYRKYFITVFITCLISIILVSTFLILMHTSKADAINSTYEIYGKYHLEVYDVSDIAINNMQMSSLVKDYLSINQQIHSYNEYDFRIVYSNEKYVDFTNVKLVQGKFPENANEVLTEKWFLFQLGLDENNMIGSKIVLPDFTEESEVKKSM